MKTINNELISPELGRVIDEVKTDSIRRFEIEDTPVLISEYERCRLDIINIEDKFYFQYMKKIQQWEEEIEVYLCQKMLVYEDRFDTKPVAYYRCLIQDYGLSFENLLDMSKSIIDTYQYNIITLEILCLLIEIEADKNKWKEDLTTLN